MLPSELLRARVSRGKIRPVFVALDGDGLALAERLTRTFGEGVGAPRGALLDRLREIEGEGHDFKLVRGLSTLLERRALFEAESGGLDPATVRSAVFREASRARALTPEERRGVLGRVAGGMRVSPEALERALFCDVDDELVLRSFRPFSSSETLLRYYNLSLTQTLLFKSLRVEFSASGNWKGILRDVKRLGLIYSVERDEAKGGRFRVSIDGPLSLFKMTERYGTSIAKLLPRIIACDEWDLKAEILSRSRGRKVYEFEAESGELGSLMVDARWEGEDAAPAEPLYDSGTEERFARSFVSCGTGWTLTREPDPLVAGTHVLIPDFVLEKHGTRVYLEVVGFWTPEYLERKVAKLGALAPDIDIVVAADESLACAKLERLKQRRGVLVVYYRRDVPLKPIIEHLREREASLFRRQAERLAEGGGPPIELQGDIVRMRDIAEKRGVAVASVRMALRDLRPEGYAKVGESAFVSTSKLAEVAGKLRGVEMLTDALAIIEASGFGADEGNEVLDALGYSSVWEGMDMTRVRISKRASAPSPGP
ncbi:MAG: DUF790 family protein [Nitrososphaerales archaeon]